MNQKMVRRQTVCIQRSKFLYLSCKKYGVIYRIVVKIEIASTTTWKNEYNKGLDSLLSSKIPAKKCYGIYCGNEILKKEFGLVLPWNIFLQQLYDGKIEINYAES